jgi:nicotinamidase-related amidase
MWDSGGWRAKNTRSLEAPKTASNRHGYDIVDEIAPSAKDIVIYKQKPSGFFGTPMTGYLTQLQCDSVIVTGTTTSGCVRATVVDAFSYNYRVAMVEEGCFDRSQASHAMTLCDLGAKYADIVKSEDVLSYFDTLQTGMFDLPKGIPA